MPGTHLEAPLFIKEISESAVDIARTPFFFNDGGAPTFLDAPPAGATALTPAATDPAMAQGNEYAVAQVIGVKPNPPYGLETQLGFAAEQVAFAPLWATRDIAAAFGITLVEPGQVVQVRSPVVHLQQIEYEYGVFAGHWSPYQGTGNSLLSVVCTDLEHHDFPHVFASTDASQPLVISVGRYWPRLGRILGFPSLGPGASQVRVGGGPIHHPHHAGLAQGGADLQHSPDDVREIRISQRFGDGVLGDVQGVVP